MLTFLKEKFSTLAKKLSTKSHLNNDEIDVLLKQIRVALLDSDLSLELADIFVHELRVKIEVINEKGVINYGKAICDAMQNQIVDFLSDSIQEEVHSENNLTLLKKTLNIKDGLNVILFLGLQGVGKTTTVAKLATLLAQKLSKKVVVASLDETRAAAKEQLKTLVEGSAVEFLDCEGFSNIVEKASMCVKLAHTRESNVIILDTAGRTDVNAALMAEIAEIHNTIKPSETIFVCDAMLGQQAPIIGKAFAEAVPITGIILTRLDGDAKGGSMLSMKRAVGAPIKFITSGEKLDAIEIFHPLRIASRIMGLGDIALLIEKASDVVDEMSEEQLMKKVQSGKFTLTDYVQYMKKIGKMGGLSVMIGLLPGLPKIDQKQQQELARKVRNQIAIVSSMTAKEKEKPDILDGKRKLRIANGSGTKVQDVNALLKEYNMIAGVLKQMKNMRLGDQMKIMQNMFKR
ncbi:Signal recognition particle protein [Candidatus Fokinia solitaria]|uniref:signal-recognition-particle GTPase n=1 Tax=Candidatus Fokinia solitaria TaxID=1802984 RepID=A0A2U8BSU5_9RICK|nr:signal recognition particle receptor subunit alpha [Candidatus Fokinia solitaria]AWD33393.1 Signal recognition particle protein [Candidatus Fokinia solitaria]